VRKSLKPFFVSTPLASGPRNQKPSAASLGRTDCSQGDVLGACYKSVSAGAETCPGSPNWWAQIDCDRARTPKPEMRWVVHLAPRILRRVEPPKPETFPHLTPHLQLETRHPLRPRLRRVPHLVPLPTISYLTFGWAIEPFRTCGVHRNSFRWARSGIEAIR